MRIFWQLISVGERPSAFFRDMAQVHFHAPSADPIPCSSQQHTLASVANRLIKLGRGYTEGMREELETRDWRGSKQICTCMKFSKDK